MVDLSVVNDISFNQDMDFIALATSSGFSIYNLDPNFHPKIQRNIEGGIKKVQMVGSSNIVFLVPTG